MNLGKENETIEFKKSTGKLKEAMNDICAILNKHGEGASIDISAWDCMCTFNMKKLYI